MPKIIEDAIELATEAHRDQKDKNGQPYIYHPIRVMLAVQSDYEKMVAIMHDIIEDTNWTLEDIAMEGFPNEVVKAVKAITKKKNQPYDEYLEIVKANPIARTIKIADVRDNASPMRLYMLSPDTVIRLTKKYSMALKYLLEE